MDQIREEGPEQQPAPQDPHRLVYVMLVVLIICGGNGLGILAAALIWKCTGLMAPAISVAVGITVLALAAAMLLVVSHNKKRK